MDLDNFNLEDFFLQNYGESQSGPMNETNQDFPFFAHSSSIADISYSSNKTSDRANKTSEVILNTCTVPTSQVATQNQLNLDCYKNVSDFDWTSFLTDAETQNAQLETSGIISTLKLDTDNNSGFTSTEYSTLHPVANVPDSLREVLSTPKQKSGFLLPTAVNKFRTSYLHSDATNKNCGAQSGHKCHVLGPSDGTSSSLVAVPESWDSMITDSTIKTLSATDVPSSSYGTISISSTDSETSNAPLSDCTFGTISTPQTSNACTLSISTTVPEMSSVSHPMGSISSSHTDIPNQLQTYWPVATTHYSNASNETFTSNTLHVDTLKSQNEIPHDSCVVFCPNSSTENDFGWAEFFIRMPSLGSTHEEPTVQTTDVASSDPVCSITATLNSKDENSGSHFQWSQNLTSTPVTSAQTTGFANFPDSIHDSKIQYNEIVTVQSEGGILETKEEEWPHSYIATKEQKNTELKDDLLVNERNSSSIDGQEVSEKVSDESTLMLTDLDTMRIFEAPDVIYKNVPHTIDYTKQNVVISESLSNLNIGNKVQIHEVSSATDKNSGYIQPGNSKKTKASIPVSNGSSKDSPGDDDPDEIVFVSEKQLFSRPIITRKPRATRVMTGDINTLLRCVEESIKVMKCAPQVKVRKPRKYQYPPKYSTDAAILNKEVKLEETYQPESPTSNNLSSNDSNKSNCIINLTELSDEDEDDKTIGKYRCLNCGRRCLMLKSLKAHKLRCYANMSEKIDSIQSQILDRPANFEIKSETNNQGVNIMPRKEVKKMEEPAVTPMMSESRSMRPRRSKRILNKGDYSEELVETVTSPVKRKAEEQPDPVKVFVLERPQPVQISKKNTSQAVNPYSCHLCDMTYKLKARFETHVRTHADCICQLCQKSFGLRSQFTTHAKTCGKPSKKSKRKN